MVGLLLIGRRHPLGFRHEQDGHPAERSQAESNVQQLGSIMKHGLLHHHLMRVGRVIDHINNDFRTAIAKNRRQIFSGQLPNHIGVGNISHITSRLSTVKLDKSSLHPSEELS